MPVAAVKKWSINGRKKMIKVEKIFTDKKNKIEEKFKSAFA